MMYGRRLRHLLVVWGVSLLFLVGLYRLELRIPALHEMLRPLYWLVVGTAAFFTWRWVRTRSRGDRRHEERRHEERRDPSAEGES